MLTGGGTLGPATPLLAVADALRQKDSEVRLIWVGTPNGPERALVEEAGIPFVSLHVPKFQRYVTWKWLLIPFELLWSIFRAKIILLKYRPSWVVSAGGFNSVPLAWLARFFGAKVLIHQLDYVAGLANRVMAPVAHVVTATWPIAKEQFPKKNVQVIGSPSYVKHLLSSSTERALKRFDLDTGKPTVLVIGGGSGSLIINSAMERLADKLVQDVNILHATGRGKLIFNDRSSPDGYYVTELFVDDFGDAFNLADVIVTRAGLGTLTELVYGKKVSILIPIQNSHQEKNADAALEAGACIVVEESQLGGNILLEKIREALDPRTRHMLEENIGNLFPTKGVAEKIAEILI